MLNRLRAYAACHLQAASSSFHALWQKPLSNMTTVIVIAIALTLPTLGLVFTDNLYQLTKDWQKGSRISLYLKTSVTAKEEAALQKTIQSQAGVGEVQLISKAEALKTLEKQEGMQDIMRYLPDNPLPATVQVIPSIALNTPEKITVLYEQLKQLPQVEQAKLDREWIARLHAILHFIKKIAEALMVLLASSVVLVVGNTLRLAIYNQREEIQVLKLIGASDPFILRPFLYTGIWYGLLAAIFAILLVNIFMLSVAVAFQDLAKVYEMHYPILGLTVKQAYCIMLSATFLSWLGARLSVKKQIAAIEPL